MPNDAPSLRDTIEAAMTATPEPEPGETTTTEAPEPVDTPAADAAPQPAPSPERARDEAGRFIPKAGETPAAAKAPAAPKGVQKAAGEAAAGPQGKPAGTTSSTVPAGPPVAPEVKPAPVKAPQAFKAAVRELAQKLPSEFHPILEEAVRIDNEAKKALNDSAQARHLAQQVQQTLAPYETIARANGMDSMQYAGSVLQTAAALQMGTPQQRAAVVANIIATYGVDVEAINAAMGGQAPRQAPQQQPQDVSSLVQKELDRRLQEATQQKAAQAWQEFVASEPEFLEDVREDMALVLEKAGREGRNVTYQQAYDAACKLNDGVRDVITQREAAKKSAEAARAQAPTVRQAKAAAVSVKSTPGTTATRPAGPRSLREDIEAAVAGQR